MSDKSEYCGNMVKYISKELFNAWDTPWKIINEIMRIMQWPYISIYFIITLYIIISYMFFSSQILEV